MALGVFAIVGVNTLAASLQRALGAEGRMLLGGDVSFSRMNWDLEPDERSYLSGRGEVLTVATLRAMARATGGEAALVEVKGVPADWPKLGAVQLSPDQPIADALSKKDGVDGAAVEQALLDRLAIKVGDRLSIGDAQFVIRAVLISEPDRLALGVGFGPRVLVSRTALEASGLAGQDALVRYTSRVALAGVPPPASALQKLIDDANAKFPDAGWETRTRDNVSPDFAKNIDRFAEYLTLVGLFSLIVGGAGVAIAARGFVARKRPTLAILKSFGASGGEAAGVLIVEFLIVAAFGVLLGGVLGEAVPFAAAGALDALLPLPLAPALDPGAFAYGALYGFATALVFALPALGRAHAEKPMATFRGVLNETNVRTPWRYPIGAGVAFLALIAAATVGSPQPLVAVVAIAASLVAVVALWALGLALRRVARRPAKARGFAWRYALANVGRKGSPAPSVLMALGLGFGVLIALTLIDANLRGQLARVAAGQTPAYYFLDVRASEAEHFGAFLGGQAAEGKVVSVPMLRGRIVKLNGVAAETIHAKDSVSWALDGDRGITFADKPPEHSEITEGMWWGADYSGPPLVSFEEAVGKGLGLKLGDTIEVNVLGRPVTARIANFRKVDWRSFAVNFVMVFSPDAFKGAPYSDLVSLTFGDGGDGPTGLVRAIASNFPDVVSIPVREAIATVDDLVANLAFAIRLVSLLALASALFVLAAALSVDRQQREREGAILKAIGATRWILLQAAAWEYAILGAAAAIVGSVLGSLAAAIVVIALFEFDFSLPVLPFIDALIAGPIITVALGLIGTWRSLSARPAQVLRDL